MLAFHNFSLKKFSVKTYQIIAQFIKYCQHNYDLESTLHANPTRTLCVVFWTFFSLSRSLSFSCTYKNLSFSFLAIHKDIFHIMLHLRMVQAYYYEQITHINATHKVILCLYDNDYCVICFLCHVTNKHGEIIYLCNG
jgi:hypothetical protein